MTKPIEKRARLRTRGRWTAAAVALCVGVAMLHTPEASAANRKLREARERYRRVQEQLNRLASDYAKQEEKAENLQIKISSTGKKIKKAQGEAAQLQERLQSRIRTAYRLGGVGFFNFLLSSRSFRDFSLRAVLLERQAARDEDLILKLRRVRAELTSQQKSLSSQKKKQTDILAGLRNKAAELDSAFGTAKALLARLEAIQLGFDFRTRRGERASGRVVGLSRCPAAGPHAFSNDWGAPRGGGRRRHQGNDIFAPMGSSAVAAVSGVVTRHGSGGAGGLSIYMYGDNGAELYYAHMSGFATPVGARVGAGQTVGYVGNTGNARGGAPHIHFEIHPGGGGAINPYASLVRVC